jgi:hypothetical protein
MAGIIHKRFNRHSVFDLKFFLHKRVKKIKTKQYIGFIIKWKVTKLSAPKSPPYNMLNASEQKTNPVNITKPLQPIR